MADHADPSSPPTPLTVGVVVWSEDPELPPTVVAGAGVEEVAKRVALEIDDALRAPFGFAGATEFLASHPVLTEQSSAAQIRQWLEDLDRGTPYPSWSMHDVPTDTGIGTANWYAKEHRIASPALEEQRAAVDQPARQPTNLEVLLRDLLNRPGCRGGSEFPRG